MSSVKRFVALRERGRESQLRVRLLGRPSNRSRVLRADWPTCLPNNDHAGARGADSEPHPRHRSRRLFQLDAASDGIDPVTDGVALELSTPGGMFYPAGDDVMPVGMRTIRGGWAITDAERTRTGIEFFVIQRTANPTRFRYVFLDGGSNIPVGDYSQVRLDLEVGDDQGSVDMNLVAGRRGVWFLP